MESSAQPTCVYLPITGPAGFASTVIRDVVRIGVVMVGAHTPLECIACVLAPMEASH